MCMQTTVGALQSVQNTCLSFPKGLEHSSMRPNVASTLLEAETSSLSRNTPLLIPAWALHPFPQSASRDHTPGTLRWKGYLPQPRKHRIASQPLLSDISVEKDEDELGEQDSALPQTSD